MNVRNWIKCTTLLTQPYLCLQAFQISNLIREYIEVLRTGVGCNGNTDTVNNKNNMNSSIYGAFTQGPNPAAVMGGNPMSVLNKPNQNLMAMSQTTDAYG